MSFKEIKQFWNWLLLASLIGGLVAILLIASLVWWQQDNLVNWLISLTSQQLVQQISQPIESFDTKSDDITKETATDISQVLSTDRAVIQAVEKTNPAVVAILATRELPDFDFSQIWPPGPQSVGSGSGFIVSADGLIITNRHVVDDPRLEYAVLTNDGKQYSAKIVDRDPFLDIAVLSIEADNLPWLRFADSDQLQIGQTVIAIGNALGEFRNTVSVGVISGLSRSVMAGDARGRSELLDEVIQTDAAINLGNSGGPLLDLSGRVVGVNVATAIGGQNIGFALPANPVRQVLASIQSHGRIVRPFLGIRYVAVTPELARLNNLPVDHGVLVVAGPTQTEPAVTPGSPAQTAGLKAGDIITHWQGQPITLKEPLASLIRRQSVGDQISLTVRRGAEVLTLTATLAEMPKQ